METVNIFFIYAPRCSHCKQMEAVIGTAVEKSKIPCNIKKMLYTDRVAINIASKNGVDNLPAVVIGAKGGSFCGDDYDEERIINAIKKASWKTKKTKKK